MSSAAYTEAALLFGDSLTQAWTEGSIAQRLAEFYLRRLDIVNRGFGGYNSEWGIPVFEQVFGKRADRELGRAQEVKLMTIWWGANDSVLPGSPQYIPLDRFKENLSRMVWLVRNPASEWYSPDTKIVLITPPPIIEAARLERQNIRWGEFGSVGEPPKLDRNAANTKLYADAVLEVAKAEGVPAVDLWTDIVKAAGGEGDEELSPYFYDGLHLTSEGYQILFDSLTSLIVTTWPELEPESMPMRLPHHGDVDPSNPRGNIGPRKDTPVHGKDEL